MKKRKCYWLLTIFLTLTAIDEGSTEPDCHSITNGAHFKDFGNCVYTRAFFGDGTGFVRLDFSEAKGNEITEFFQKASTSTTLSAAIRLVNNSDIQQIDFGLVNAWQAVAVPDGELFCEIVNNAALNSIIWKLDTYTTINVGDKVKILFYNNPKLTLDDTILDTIEQKVAAENKYIEKRPHVCRFQHPLNVEQYDMPETKVLEECKHFKGDLKLDKGALTGDIVFEDGCLILKNVNMEKVAAITATGGKQACESKPKEPSAITGNKGLCGGNMKTLVGYFPPGPAVTTVLDPSCTKICKSQPEVDDEYYRCSKINGDVDIARWFTQAGLKENQQELTTAQGKVTIKAGGMAAISLPSVTEMSYLEISGNQALTSLDLKNLSKIPELVIANNAKLGLQEIGKGLPNVSPTKRTIECNPLAKDVTDVGQLRLCTIINGNLKLSKVQEDVSETDFNITDVKGCLTVENTQLSNLDFLKKANIQCPGKHVLKGNPKLCQPAFLGAKVDISPKNPDCGKECVTLSVHDCVVFKGDLKVDNSTTPAVLKLLKTIKGRLVISGTTHASLEFPALETIFASKVPVLEVTNNAKLTSLKIPKLAKITTAAPGTPRVKIENNPVLSSDLRQFLPASIKCSKSASSDCQYDQGKEDEQGVSILLVGIGVAVVLLLLGGIGAGAFFYVKKKKSQSKIPESEDSGTGDEASNAKSTVSDFTDEYGGNPSVTKEMQDVSELLKAIRPFPQTAHIDTVTLMAEGIETLPHGPLQFRYIANTRIQYDHYITTTEARKKRFPRFRFNRGVMLVRKEYVCHQQDFITQIRRQMKYRMEAEKQQKKEKKEAPRKKKVGEEKSDDDKEEEEEEEEESRKKGGKGKEEKKAEKEAKKVEAGKETKGKNKSTLNKNENKKKPAAESKVETGKATSKKTYPYILHIGNGFSKSQEFDANMRITPAKGQERIAMTHKKSGLKCSIVHIKYTSGKETLIDEDFVLLELIANTSMIGTMDRLYRYPWFGLLQQAFKSKWTINTDAPDYFALAYYIYWSLDLIHGWISGLTPKETKNFIVDTLYPAFKDLYEPSLTTYDGVSALQLFVILMLQWHRLLEPNPERAKAIKKDIEILLLSDILYVRMGDHENKKYWKNAAALYLNHARFPLTAAAFGHEKFNTLRLYPPESADFYQANEDVTAWSLMQTVNRLPLVPVIEFEKEDEETECLQPQKSLSALSVIDIPQFNEARRDNDPVNAAGTSLKPLPTFSGMSMVKSQAPTTEKEESKKTKTEKTPGKQEDKAKANKKAGKKSDDKPKKTKKKEKKKEKEDSDSED